MFERGASVAVTAHDAGAANLIVGWLRDCDGVDFRFCVDGPARKSFSENFPTYQNIALSDALDGAQALLSGTSGDSTLEHDARAMARKLGIHSVGVIDHWVNYRERFIRGGVLVLPDEVWVSDEYALREAKKCFPELPVRQYANRYLEQTVAEAMKCDLPKQAGHTRILYVLEPIRAWGNENYPGEFQSLDHFLIRLPTLVDANDIVEIRLRLHPSESPRKYTEWIARNRERYRIALDLDHSLAEAIGWADWVVGCETNAMVVALQAGKRVYSSLPSTAPACRLPFPEINHLAKMS